MLILLPMRVQVVDPPAFTPPYDHSLCAALSEAGAEVELVTSRYLYGTPPSQSGYRVNEAFYRRSTVRGLDARGRRALKLVEHLRDMARYRRHAERADLVHWQWFPVPQVDRYLLAPKRPRVFTLHHFLPEHPSRRQARAVRRRLESMDGVVMHSEHGRRRMEEEFGVRDGLIEVIPHGALDYLTRQPDEQPLPPELAAVEGPVILAFGIIRPYKGTDVLLHAFREVEGAELWIAGKPMTEMEPLRELARQAPGKVRIFDRFVPDTELPALIRRADLLVLPYRTVEQSGVLYTGLAFGKPMVLSAVGGFPEVAAHGAARLVPPGDEAELAAVLSELVASPEDRRRLADAARKAASTHYSWAQIGERHVELYRRLLERR
ncbi:MAG: glycosyltransferase family 4 protein [Solirubrobacterales bacterium]